jgi:hypothetical protein
MTKFIRIKRLIGAALLALVFLAPAGILHAAGLFQGEITPPPVVPSYDLPQIIADVLGWGYSSSAVVQLLRHAAAALDPKLGNGVGASVITLAVAFAGTLYGAMNGALGHPARGVSDYLAYGALFLLSMTVAYKTYIGRLLPDPQPALLLGSRA